MKNVTLNNRIRNKVIILAIMGIMAVMTWMNNEKKEQKEVANLQPDSAQFSSHQLAFSDLEDYDTIMERDNFGQNNATVDYYRLALSWSPSFCEGQRRKNNGNVPHHLKLQCNQAATLGWVIHGLWPQNANARFISEHPRFCRGDLPKLPAVLIKKYLPESPGARLLQGQWEKHGACAFHDAESYFAKQKELFRHLNLPGQELTRKELFQWMKKFNPQLKNVRLSASKDELYICYDKQWKAIDCR